MQHHSQAQLEAQAGNLSAAAALLSQACQRFPDNPRVQGDLGAVLIALGRHEEALAALQAALALNPEDPQAWHHHGLALKGLGRSEQALHSYARSLSLVDAVLTRCNRAVLLHQLGRWNEALADLDQALKLNPAHAPAHYNRGNTLQAQGRWQEALAAYDQALALQPDFAAAHSNRADVLRELARLDEALAGYQQALARAPNQPDTRFNRALAWLLQGRYEEGFEAYEWRWQRDGRQRWQRHFTQPLWLGAQALAGKTVLLHAEQGLGDTVQFCRYVPLVQALGAEVVLEVPPSLLGLMAGVPGAHALVAAGQALPPFDLHCPLGSLPHALRTTLHTVPAQVPYLSVPLPRRQRWARHFGEEGFRIGICWQGQPGPVDAGRSFPLALFKRMAALPGVRLISLHKGAGEQQLTQLPPGMQVEVPPPDFDAEVQAAFLDTAAVMQHCHLVITSDTAVAHLAGALGLPVWLVLKQVPDWRWLLHRQDSPWYPTMRLFRQPEAGDWNTPFAMMEAELLKRLEAP